MKQKSKRIFNSSSALICAHLKSHFNDIQQKGFYVVNVCYFAVAVVIYEVWLSIAMSNNVHFFLFFLVRADFLLSFRQMASIPA